MVKTGDIVHGTNTLSTPGLVRPPCADTHGGHSHGLVSRQLGCAWPQRNVRVLRNARVLRHTQGQHRNSCGIVMRLCIARVPA